MVKAATSKKRKATTSKKSQYVRFQQTARDLGIDDEESMRKFERAFAKIVPAKRQTKSS